MFKNFCKNKYKKGMTLVELMVVIAILMILSSVTIFNSSNLNSHTTTQNLSDDIALSIRKAQSYAIGVHGTTSGTFDYGYGVNFTTNAPTNIKNESSSKSFILFTDIDGDGAYDHDSSGSCGTPTATNECLEILNITSPDKVSAISFGLAGREDPKPADADSSFDVVFKRPNPEPTFCYRNNTHSPCGGEKIYYLKVEVSNTKNQGVTKTIIVSNNGQISVD